MFRKSAVFALIIVVISLFYITAFAAPVSVDGNMLVPFRDIFSILGAEVYWDPISRTGSATIGDFRVGSAVGERFLIVNGERFDMPVATQIIEDKIFVPVRACAEAFRCTVGYDSASGTVVITKGALPWSLGDVFRGIISAKGWVGAHVALQVGDTVDVNGISCATVNAYSEYGLVGSFAVSYDLAYVFELVDGWYSPLNISR